MPNFTGEWQRRGERLGLSLSKIAAWRNGARYDVPDLWKVRLERSRHGVRTVEAYRPLLREWLSRRHWALSFRLVQVLTGRGCFDKYLHTVVGGRGRRESGEVMVRTTFNN